MYLFIYILEYSKFIAVIYNNIYMTDSEKVLIRKQIVNAWNGQYAFGIVNGLKLVGGQYKAINNISDFLSRQNYSCGGPSQVQASKPGMRRLIGTNPNNCDGTNIPPSSTNTKFVSDSSDYIRFRKQRAINNANQINIINYIQLIIEGINWSELSTEYQQYILSIAPSPIVSIGDGSIRIVMKDIKKNKIDRYTDILKFYIKTTEIVDYIQWIKDTDNLPWDNNELLDFIELQVYYLFEFLLSDMIKYKLMIAEIFPKPSVLGGVETISQLNLESLITPS